jgi:hypothetical protein
MNNLNIQFSQENPIFSSGLDVRIPGNSGCQVEVLSGHVPSVRKTSLSSDYHERLSHQREKQQSCKPDVPGIVIPKVIAFNNNSFTMEYLQMLDAIEFLERATPATIQKRFQIVFDFIHWELASVEWQEVPSDSFTEKLDNIRSHVPDHVWEQFYAGSTHALQQKLSRPISLPIGQCHGDLTYSNIMFALDDNQVGLIDFLDSFIETPLIDLVKLRQDTRYHWTITRYPRLHDQGKIRLVNRWIDGLIEKMFEKWINNSAFVCLEIINYLRIAPYVSATNEHGYLSDVIKELSLQLEVYQCI